jgi:hypothetical protein
MNKFSDVFNESNRYDFVLTDEQFNEYKKFINELLETTYSDRTVNISDVENGKLIVYKAYDYEKLQMPGREFSVLGKVNTNRSLITKIWNKFNIQDFRHLKNLVRKMCRDLFDEKGRFFKSNPGGFSVWDTIRYTESIGEENEKKVCDFIESIYGPESTPVREVTSSHKDMILGIDITFKIEGVEKTCQVKPLNFDSFKERGVIVVYSSGVIKDYETDYIAFINTKKGKCLFFKNEGSVFDSKSQTITLPYQNLVNKKFVTDNDNQG